MSLATQPANLNFLSPLGFQLKIDRLPKTTFMCQAAQIPGLSMSPAIVRNPFVDIPTPGDKIGFEPLSVRFKVLEDMSNYIEIVNWIFGLGHPTTLDEYRQLTETNVGGLRPGNKFNVRSDATLIILTSHNNPQIAVVFEELFPLSIQALNFDTTTDDVQYIEADASFAYRNFTISTL